MGEGIITLIILFIVVLAITWIILPFLVMGVNNRLDKLIRIMQQQGSGVTPGKRTPPTERASKPKVEGGENSTLKALVVLAVLGAVAVLIYYGGM